MQRNVSMESASHYFLPRGWRESSHNNKFFYSPLSLKQCIVFHKTNVHGDLWLSGNKTNKKSTINFNCLWSFVYSMVQKFTFFMVYLTSTTPCFVLLLNSGFCDAGAEHVSVHRSLESAHAARFPVRHENGKSNERVTDQVPANWSRQENYNG